MLRYNDNPRTNHAQDLEEHQRGAVLQQVIQHLTSRNSTSKPNWKQFPLKRYSQLLKQLHLVDGVLCRRFVPGPLEEIITVPVMPTLLQEVALRSCHDITGPAHTVRLVRLWPHQLSVPKWACPICERHSAFIL